MKTCRNCKTETAPSVQMLEAQDKWLVSCPRCGFQAWALVLRDALVDWYAPEEQEGETLPKCKCGGEAHVWAYEPDMSDAVAGCKRCGASTPVYPDPAEARACWRRMMEVER